MRRVQAVRVLVSVMMGSLGAIFALIPPAAADPGVFYIQNASVGKCLEVIANGSYNGAPLRLANCRRTATQAWRFERYTYGPAANEQYSTTWYYIRSQASGKCLDVAGASLQDRTTIYVWDCLGGSNQQWARGGGRNNSEILVARHTYNSVLTAAISRVTATPLNPYRIFIEQQLYRGRPNQEWRLHS